MQTLNPKLRITLLVFFALGFWILPSVSHMHGELHAKIVPNKRILLGGGKTPILYYIYIYLFIYLFMCVCVYKSAWAMWQYFI